MRRDREDGDDTQPDGRVQSDFAFQSKQSNDTGIDDGDGDAVECKCAGGWNGAIHGDGYGEFEYERDLER